MAVKPGAELAGIVLISGRLRADVHNDNPNANGVRAYRGEDPSRYDERSPVTWADHCRVPVMIAIAGYENPYLDVYAAELFHRVSVARKRSPRFVRMTQHNHTSMVAHFNSGEETLGRELLDFMANCRDALPVRKYCPQPRSTGLSEAITSRRS